MSKETFADRLKLAMDQQKVKQVDLLRMAEERGIKLGKSHVSQYVRVFSAFWRKPFRWRRAG